MFFSLYIQNSNLEVFTFWTGLISGIPQGSILGPSSIYIHTDDIELVLSLLVDLPAPCSHPTH